MIEKKIEDTFENVRAWLSYYIDELQHTDDLVLENPPAIGGDYDAVFPVLLAINLNHANGNKYHKVLRYFQHFRPTLVWLMEQWVEMSSPPMYRAFGTHYVYQSTLSVHQLYESRHYFTKMKHGILTYNYSFQYLFPTAKAEEMRNACLNHQQVIGDLNILSLKLKLNLFVEIRNEKIGRMSSILPSKFYYFPSDHHTMVTRISWKVHLKQDYAKLKKSLFIAQWRR